MVAVMVQNDETNRIRSKWRQAGEPLCEHARVDKEYFLSENTGDNVCLDCGEAWSRTDPACPPQR